MFSSFSSHLYWCKDAIFRTYSFIITIIYLKYFIILENQSQFFALFCFVSYEKIKIKKTDVMLETEKKKEFSFHESSAGLVEISALVAFAHAFAFGMVPAGTWSYDVCLNVTNRLLKKRLLTIQGQDYPKPAKWVEMIREK